MTNGEKFKTIEERVKQFKKFCNHACWECQLKEARDTIRCPFNWLNLEYEEELQPCPLCGHTDIRMRQYANTGVWYICCNGCGCRTGGNVVKDMAVEIWNGRVL